MSRLSFSFATSAKEDLPASVGEESEEDAAMSEVLALAAEPLVLEPLPDHNAWFVVGTAGAPAFENRWTSLATMSTVTFQPIGFFDFDPNQERGPDGKWIPEGGGGDAKKDDTADERAEFGALKTRWAELDRKLLPYAGQPRNPEAVKIMDEQLQTVRDMHALDLDEGTPEGVGLPGGPRDVVIVGAGPAGLQAAINGGTEGLDTLLVDQNPLPGGQIALSSRVENVLGFPAGVSGAEIAQTGLEQAQRVGAEAKLGVACTGLSYDPDTGLKTLTFSDGSTADARAVVIAGGVQFNTMTFPGADSKGVVYGDSQTVKELSEGGHAVIVGGGNSAGQAAVDVASKAESVTLLVRGDSLTESMSPYLIDQLEGDPHVSIRYGAEVASATAATPGGDLQSVTLRDGTVLPTSALGAFVGSSPKTDWAASVEREPHGFIRTGGSGSSSPLETNIPGVYAAGDVRDGSQHRVVGAAGDGGLAVASAWQYVTKNFGQAKAGRAATIRFSIAKRDPGNAFLEQVAKLDREEPYTGFDPAP